MRIPLLIRQHFYTEMAPRGPSTITSLIARLMGPIWGPSGATGPRWAPWTLLSGMATMIQFTKHCMYIESHIYCNYLSMLQFKSSWHLWFSIKPLWGMLALQQQAHLINNLSLTNKILWTCHSKILWSSYVFQGTVLLQRSDTFAIISANGSAAFNESCAPIG